VKQTYVTPEVHIAGTVAGLTRSNTPGACSDFENARGPHRPGNCEVFPLPNS
jgi:hypothetical protein